ncbi:MAG: inositol monophosphatase [Mariniblastus sp.]|nr:inositol monophosphatase [Mariniblastus sp.]
MDIHPREDSFQLPFRPSPQLEVALRAAEAAGRIINDFYRTGFQASVKQTAGQSAGLVTEADMAAEQAIVQTVRNAFPTDHILAEETAAKAIETVEANQIEKALWVIDPLDGTNNFAHRIPHFSISIACCHQGKPTCGVVLDPLHNDWYVAERGKGAWHNQQKVRVNDHTELSETMVAVGFYYDRGEMMRSTLAAMEDFFNLNVHGIRRMGSAALDLVSVAVGRFGVYFEYFLSPWDFAAAWLFLQEAGGVITDGHGEDLQLRPSSVLASNPHLSEQALSIVNRNHPMDGP